MGHLHEQLQAPVGGSENSSSISLVPACQRHQCHPLSASSWGGHHTVTFWALALSLSRGATTCFSP